MTSKPFNPKYQRGQLVAIDNRVPLSILPNQPPCEITDVIKHYRGDGKVYYLYKFINGVSLNECFLKEAIPLAPTK